MRGFLVYCNKRLTPSLRVVRQSAVDSYIVVELFLFFLVFHYAHPYQNPSSVVEAVRRSINGLELSKIVVFGDFNLHFYNDNRRNQFLKLSDLLAELRILYE